MRRALVSQSGSSLPGSILPATSSNGTCCHSSLLAAHPCLRTCLIVTAAADNYIETVHGGLEMETNPPYLMYTHGNDEVR